MASALQQFVNVRRDEVPSLLASVFFFFCVLSALMVIRPAREALGMQSGLDTVRWLFVGTAVVTLLVSPVFAYLVSRFRRTTFIGLTYAFFAASLLVFWALLAFAPDAAGEVSGRVFYVWFSVFNLFSTMVFWALMVDRFTLEQSKRLFGVIAVGGTLGAIFGPWFAWTYVDALGTANLIVIAVLFLTLAIVAAFVVVRLQPQSLTQAEGAGAAQASTLDDKEIIGGNAWDGFRSVVKSPYLLGICAFVLLMALMSTFIYFTRLAYVEQMTNVTDERTGFFAQIDFWTQFLTFLLQLLITGHIMRRLGVSIAMILLPITVSLGFIGLAMTGTFVALILLEASYRAVQRGITRPARETLFTVVAREDKYKSKALTDTFVYRGGDVLGAWTEGLLGRLGGGLVALSSLVVPLAVVWAGLALWLGRYQQRVVREGGGLDGTAGSVPTDATTQPAAR
ncbi:MAG: MFS transporter [Gammaproteobacteria bacterium]|nr:MFS transporter [Gammaproteobacteria bacterium]